MKRIYGKIEIGLYDPFIPPNELEEEAIMDSYGTDVIDFLNTHTPIISSGAWHLTLNDGIDLYGLDMMIDLVAKIRGPYPTIGLLFFIGDPEFNRGYVESCIKRIDDLGLTGNIMLVTGQKELWPTIRRSNLFIRATTTDGDPISIKEALFFGIKVLASDCVVRANGTNLFISRNSDSLASETLKILKRE